MSSAVAQIQSIPAPAADSQAKQSKRREIKPLTALRFFTAVALVFAHSQDYFGHSSGAGVESHFFLPVIPFFFMLSGFVLTYNYSNLTGVRSAVSFYVARFSRIWPAHMLTLLLLIAIVPEIFRVHWKDVPMFLANVCLVQSWIPCRQIYFSYNAPSWTNSVEIFFYLLFPLLLWGLKRRWYLVLAAEVAVVGSLIWFSRALALPEFDPTHLSLQATLFVSPLCRLFEFTIGMTAAMLFDRVLCRLRVGRFAGTLLEIAALTTVVVLDIYANQCRFAATAWLGEPGSLWLLNSGLPIIGCAFTILVLATEQGMLAKLLSWRVLVWLGELSFSIYMLHGVMLAYRALNFPEKSSWLSCALYVLTLFIAAHLMQVVVEKPMRQKMMAKARSIIYPDKPERTKPSAPKRTGLLIAEGMALIAVIYFSLPTIDRAATRQDRLVAATTNLCTQDLSPYLRLTAGRVTRCGSQVFVPLIWESMRSQFLDFSGVIRVLDKSGNELGRVSYELDPRFDYVTKGTVWHETREVDVTSLGEASQVSIIVLKSKRHPIGPITTVPIQ